MGLLVLGLHVLGLQRFGLHGQYWDVPGARSAPAGSRWQRSWSPFILNGMLRWRPAPSAVMCTSRAWPSLLFCAVGAASVCVAT